MQEDERYLPATLNDGPPVKGPTIEGIKEALTKAFHGSARLIHRSEGSWRMGGVTFRSEVTMASFDLTALKKSTATALELETLLIITGS